MSQKKAICIGFQKTGTTSLGLGLERLGYRVGGYDDFRDLALRTGLTLDDLRERALVQCGQYDAVKDTPYPIFFRELDVAFPDSKFVLVVREPRNWIRSVVADFGAHPNEIHRLIYGTSFPAGNEASWTERYIRHNEAVSDYFRARPTDLVVLNLDRGEVGWPKLCAFLGREVPDVPWPRANTKRAKSLKMWYWKALAKIGLR